MTLFSFFTNKPSEDVFPPELTHWLLGELKHILVVIDVSAIFKLILAVDDWGIPCEIALRWMSLDLIDDKSTLV